MGATLSVIKTLIIPAVISLILFVLSTYVLIPFWRHYRSRYSQYLPLDSISNHTSSFRSRVQSAIANRLIPSRWRMSIRERLVQADDDTGFDSDDGEELEDVDEERRHALSLDTAGRIETDSMRRLSRDLEEGFMDDSEDESDDRRTRG
ncbi:hypothetical protein BX600DRAFT_89212 [Xylariales sp. PMI_506]|nr:hypothetical protein BX600DRAFT_89212 [Xylariales sp. PMI_506]